MFERFTDRARRVLVLAQQEARVLGHNFLGTEHLLLALIRETEGVAAMALAQLGIRLDDVRDRVKETVGPAGSAPTGSPPFTPRAKRVLELSLREALQLGHNYIGTEHILLGLVREGEGVAAQILASLGGDLARVRQQVLQILAGYAPPRPVEGERFRTRVEDPRCGRCDALLSTSDGGRGSLWARGAQLPGAEGDFANAARGACPPVKSAEPRPPPSWLRARPTLSWLGQLDRLASRRQRKSHRRARYVVVLCCGYFSLGLPVWLPQLRAAQRPEATCNRSGG